MKNHMKNPTHHTFAAFVDNPLEEETLWKDMKNHMKKPILVMYVENLLEDKMF